MGFFSIKTKMIITISVMVASLLSVAAVFSLVYLQNQLKEMIGSQQYTTVSAIADQIDDKLNIAQTELTTFASTLTPEIVADPSRAAAFLAQHPDTRALFDDGVFLFSARGKMLACLPYEPQIVGKDYSFREYFNKTLATRRPQISQPFVSTQAGHPAIVMFTAPVLNRKGEVYAVVGGSIDLAKDNFLGRLAKLRLGNGGYFYLFNGSRLLIVHHDRQRMMKKPIQPGQNLLLDKALSGFEGAGETVNSQGMRSVSAFKRLKSTGWILCGSVPREEAYRPVQRVQRYVSVALALALSGSLVLVWFLTRHLTAPLLAMTEQVRALIPGKGSGTRIAAQPGREMAVLAEAFNAVLAELETQRAELKIQLDFSHVLLETIPCPVFYKGRDGRFLGCNKAFEDFLGIAPLQWKEKTVADLLAPELAEVHQKADDEVCRTHGVLAYEASLPGPDGQLHRAVFHKATFPAADGTIGGVIGTFVDITELKRAEEAHEKTRRQLQLILEAAGEGLYGVDLSGRVTFVNPAAASMTGYEPEELLGVLQHDVIHHTRADGSHYPVDECPIYAAFKDGIQRHVRDEVFWKKDGTSFPVEYVSNPILEEGVLVGAVVVFKDISDQVRAEEQLLKLSQAITQSPVSVIITGVDGIIEYVNDTFVEMSGYEVADVIGQKPGIFKSGQTNPEVYRNLWSTIRAGRVWTGELHNRRKDGEFFWERATISPIRSSAGIVTHFMAYKENITERKKLEAQLRHAQKMEAVGQLAGGVAHDFNNILTVITGFGELLQASLAAGDPRHKHMDQILSAANRASHLTGSLLAFSRKQLVLLVPTDLTKLVRKHTKFLSRIIGEDVTLESRLGTQPLMALADGGQVEQVLMNLATNGRDAMPGGGALRIVLERIQLDKEFYRQHGFGAPGEYALLTVSDTGAGMDQETQKRIFEPFFTTKEVGRGTGLGLSIVYGIVKQHGGFVTVCSEPGVGTTFNVYLPLITSCEEAQKPAAQPLPRGGSERILLAEDDPAVRDLVESVLLDYGYQVILARDGQEAVELFQAHDERVDLALFDVIMPRKSGKEACDDLRKLQPGVKVLLLSGYTADLIENRGILVHGVELIMKPVQPMELARKVREMLDA